ncbi:MAG: CotH kinase family protein, partial [Treponema sp.]|nr:CotH kinase family protein [Treponema sp.]
RNGACPAGPLSPALPFDDRTGIRDGAGMRIRRFGTGFFLLFALALASSAFFAAAAFYSSVRTEDYERLGLPVLNINTYGRKINSKENYLDAVYTLDGNGMHWGGGCKIRGRGNSTWKTVDTSKKPYLLKLDEAEALLGMGSARRWVLKASATDKSFLRDEYAFFLARRIWNRFAWTPQQRFVTLLVNGKYAGLYGLQEKIEVGPERVDMEAADGSILFKIDEHRNEQFSFTSRHGVLFNIVDTDSVSYSWDEFFAIQDFVNERERWLYGEQDGLAETGTGKDWTSYFDLDSFVDWYLVNEFTKNHDSRFQASCFISYDGKQDKFFMGPVWDFDLSSGNTDAAGCSRSDGYITAQAFWYERLLQDELFMTALRSRWAATKDELAASIDAIQGWADELEDAAVLNDRVWKSFGHRQWPNPSGWRKRKRYQDEIDYMTAYLRARLAWLESQWG